MSDAVATPAPVVAASPKKAKAPKAPKTKVPKAKVPAAHPPYIVMIKAAIKSLKDRKGASKQAILKHISQGYKLGDNVVQINAHLRTALKRGVTSGALAQAAGTGANGRFRVHEKVSADGEKKKVAKKAAVAKPKKAATGEKKAAAKPKKAATKKPAAEKKAKSPKKTIKPKVKKVAKSPAKKVAKPAAKKAAPKKAKAAPAATA